MPEITEANVPGKVVTTNQDTVAAGVIPHANFFPRMSDENFAKMEKALFGGEEEVLGVNLAGRVNRSDESSVAHRLIDMMRGSEGKLFPHDEYTAPETSENSDEKNAEEPELAPVTINPALEAELEAKIASVQAVWEQKQHAAEPEKPVVDVSKTISGLKDIMSASANSVAEQPMTPDTRQALEQLQVQMDDQVTQSETGSTLPGVATGAEAVVSGDNGLSDEPFRAEGVGANPAVGFEPVTIGSVSEVTEEVGSSARQGFEPVVEVGMGASEASPMNGIPAPEVSTVTEVSEIQAVDQIQEVAETADVSATSGFESVNVTSVSEVMEEVDSSAGRGFEPVAPAASPEMTATVGTNPELGFEPVTEVTSPEVAVEVDSNPEIGIEPVTGLSAPEAVTPVGTNPEPGIEPVTEPTTSEVITDPTAAEGKPEIFEAVPTQSVETAETEEKTGPQIYDATEINSEPVTAAEPEAETPSQPLEVVGLSEQLPGAQPEMDQNGEPEVITSADGVRVEEVALTSQEETAGEQSGVTTGEEQTNETEETYQSVTPTMTPELGANGVPVIEMSTSEPEVTEQIGATTEVATASEPSAEPQKPLTAKEAEGMPLEQVQARLAQMSDEEKLNFFQEMDTEDQIDATLKGVEKYQQELREQEGMQPYKPEIVEVDEKGRVVEIAMNEAEPEEAPLPEPALPEVTGQNVYEVTESTGDSGEIDSGVENESVSAEIINAGESVENGDLSNEINQNADKILVDQENLNDELSEVTAELEEKMTGESESAEKMPVIPSLEELLANEDTELTETEETSPETEIEELQAEEEPAAVETVESEMPTTETAGRSEFAVGLENVTRLEISKRDERIKSLREHKAMEANRDARVTAIGRYNRLIGELMKQMQMIRSLEEELEVAA